MCQFITPTKSSKLWIGVLTWFGLMFCVAIHPVAAQSGSFRTPSFRTPSLVAPEKDAAKSATGAEPVHFASRVVTKTDGNAIRLGVRQFGEPVANRQDPIEQWLGDDQDQEPVIEELPDGNSLSGDAVDGAEEIQPRDPSQNQDSETNSSSSNREVIIQRYSDGKPQIEREVMQDEEGNYLNDGYWRVYAQQGQRVILAQGQYQRGVMEGIWMRKHAKNSGGLFSTRPFTLFEGPFVSIATFKASELDGLWTLQDATNQKMFEVPYKNGKRHGTASWWYPSQAKMREVTFQDGVIHGRLREWDEQKKLVRDEEYVEGQRVIRNVTYYRPQQPETENYFLDAKLEMDGSDDWWRAEPAALVPKGSRVQHGPVTFWYENGLPKMKGNYAQGNREGRFTWWHSNGQKQLEGNFAKGLKEDSWRWWHPNGMKASEGRYQNDKPVGAWTWWTEEGKVEEQKDFSDGNSSFESKTIQPGSSENPEELPNGLSTPPNQPSNDSVNSPVKSSGQQGDPQSVFSLELDDLDPQSSPNADKGDADKTPADQAPILDDKPNSPNPYPGSTSTQPGESSKAVEQQGAPGSTGDASGTGPSQAKPENKETPSSPVVKGSFEELLNGIKK